MKVWWPIKASFVAYVEAAEGHISLTGDVVREDGGFGFAACAAALADGHCISANGGIRFTAHRGMLDVYLSSLVITLLADSICTVEVADAEEPGKQLQIARGSWRKSGKGIEARPALTFFGSRLFGDVYTPGTELDVMLIEGLSQ